MADSLSLLTMHWSCAEHHGLDSVRTASKSKKKPPTTPSPGDDARRWREGASQRDAEIAP